MDKVGLVLISHGSKLPYSKEISENLAEMLRKRSRFEIVEVGYLIRNNPTIPEAIEKAVEEGAKKLVVIPLFMTHGLHTKNEIPEILGLDKKGVSKHLKFLEGEPEVEIVYGEPLGPDERIAEIVEDRALEALESSKTIGNSVSASTLIGSKIFEDSTKIVRRLIQNELKKAPRTHRPIIERVVHATADAEFARLLLIGDRAIEAGVTAIKSGADIVTDIMMVKVGIDEDKLRKFSGRVITHVGEDRALILAKRESITNVAAGVRIAIEEGIDGDIVVIGNSPTAAFEIANALKRDAANPALIIATPVGFINATQSKDAISSLPVPSIIVRGPKGGSAVAVAITNALLSIADGGQ